MNVLILNIKETFNGQKRKKSFKKCYFLFAFSLVIIKYDRVNFQVYLRKGNDIVN